MRSPTPRTASRLRTSRRPTCTSKSGPRSATSWTRTSWPSRAKRNAPSRPPGTTGPEGDATMSESSPEPEHLSNRHRNTLRQIFQHPVSHNIEWHAVTSLLDAIGTVDVHHDGQVAVRVGSESAFFTHPEGKDVDEQMVVDLRRLLSKAGYEPS